MDHQQGMDHQQEVPSVPTDMASSSSSSAMPTGMRRRAEQDAGDLLQEDDA